MHIRVETILATETVIYAFVAKIECRGRPVSWRREHCRRRQDEPWPIG